MRFIAFGALPPGPRHSIACMGDSLTHSLVYGVRPDAQWPELLAASLRDEHGCAVVARNFGTSGQSSTQMLAEMTKMTRYAIPKLAFIWGGANDPGGGIAGATTKANLKSMVETVFAAGTSYALIPTVQYLNWSSGGDTLETPYGTYATLRPFQVAAAEELAAEYPGRVASVDTYGGMKEHIAGWDGALDDAEFAQGDHLWHPADMDQHFSGLGHPLIASIFLSAIVAQDGWIAALKKG